MKKKVLSLLLFCSALSSYAQFPYSISMKGSGTSGSTAPSGITTFDLGTNDMPMFTPSGTTLTNSTSQFSAVYLSDLEFSTSKGFIIDFAYSLYGGNQYDSKYGDGFALILFNGAVTSPRIGSKGSGLGYAYNRAGVDLNLFSTGLTQGYLGIGFDTYGGFKNYFSNSTDNRTGIKTVPPNSGDGDNITIRGPYNPKLPITISGTDLYYYTGYPVLISQSISGNSDLAINKYVINPTNGDYTTSFENITNFGGLRGSEYTNDVTNDAYRKVSVTMIPGTDSNRNVGFYLNVIIYHGLTAENIIKDYFINTSSGYSIQYLENRINFTGGTTIPAANTPLSLTPPSTLKLGFSASTGAASQVVEIKDVSVTLPYAPLVGDIRISNVCASSGHDSRFSVLTNTFGYISNLYNPTTPPEGKFEYLDLTSFRFKTLNSDGSYSLTSDPYVVTTSSGIYKYDSTTGNITFSPNASLEVTGFNADDEIYFDIKNIKSSTSTVDLSTDDYRSRTGKATISFTTTQCIEIPSEPKPKYVKING